MTYKVAKRLHNEDEITIKETGKIVSVLQTYEDPNARNIVFIECDDGNVYHHRDVK